MVYTQESRILALSTPLGKDALLLTKFTGREGLTRASRFTLETLSEFDIDPKDLIGQPVNFDVELDDGGYRVFNGLVDTVTPKGMVDKDFRRYELKIITQLDQLKKKSDNRIFKEQSWLKTITDVLDEHGVKFSDITNSDYPAHDYCVQYQETDFQFVHRLLSETGINYRITHKTGEHTVVLFDHTTHYQETKEPVIEYVDGGSAQRKFYQWQKTVKMTSGLSSQRSFNFNRPLETIKSKTQTIAAQTASQLHERYTYPGLNNVPQGSDLENRQNMERVENTHTQVTVSTSCRTLEPGHTFSFTRHVIERECEFDYVVTTIDYVAADDTYLNQGGDAQVLESHLTCIPKHILYRQAKQRPRPVVTGTQTAIVCGKAGEEIHTDELGRIRIQFHWDRQGTRDENSTCWVRVAQPWANSGYGGQFIPRVGQEVLVHFEDGDINKPLVQGTVYNGRNKPAFDLPANKTQSGSKTRSSKGADPVEYNEIRFEDKKGQEDLHVQAQKNQTTLIKDSQTRAVGNEQLLSVGKNKFEVINKNRDTIITKGHDKLQAQGDIAMQSVNGGIVFEAKNNIEFEVGGAQICLTGAGHLLLNSQLLNIDGSAAVNINGGFAPSPKRLSPMKVSDIFTTPTAGGTAVRDIEFGVEEPKEIEAPEENQASRETAVPIELAALEAGEVNAPTPLLPEEVAVTGRFFSLGKSKKQLNKEKAKVLISSEVKKLVVEFGGHLKNAKIADVANTLKAEQLMSGAITALEATSSGGQFVSGLKKGLGVVSQGKQMMSELTQAFTAVQTGDGLMTGLTSALGAIPNGDQLVPGLTDALSMASQGQKLVTDLTEASTALGYLDAGNYTFRGITENAKVNASLSVAKGGQVMSTTINAITFNASEVINLYEEGQALDESQRDAGYFLTVPSGEAGIRQLLVHEVAHTVSSSFTDPETGLLLEGLSPLAHRRDIEKAHIQKETNADVFVELINGL